MLASLRTRVIIAMLGMSLIGTLGAYLLIGQVERVEEAAAAQRDASSVANRVAKLFTTAPPDQKLLAPALGTGLGDDGVTVVQHGVKVVAIPFGGSSPTVTRSATFPGGRVDVTTSIENTRGLSLELTAISAGVLLLVAVGGVGVTEIVTRGLRRPITQAVEAADRVASGDFTARIGQIGTSEFTRLAQSFDSMAARLANSDRHERNFLADLAHEVATPVNVITGFAMSLADGTVATPAAQREAARFITTETQRLADLLEDLRHLTRLDWNEPVRRESVDLAQLCRELGARFRPNARRAAISLVVRTQPATLITDRRLVETVAVNLLTNALRYTPAAGRVTVSVKERARDVVLAVTDTGIGIPEEDRDLVFDRLYRVDEARDRVSGGSGLGLAIARRASLALGGRLEMDSKVGKGSVFRLILPRVDAEVPPEQ